MSENKKTAVSSPFVDASSEGCLTGDSVKHRPYKMYIIIAVTGIVALAIILTAILVGVRLSNTEAQKEVMKFTYNMDADAVEEVTSDMSMNLVQYHVKSEEYEMWIVNNFNRDIQVMKIHTELGTDCFMTPLNRTISNDPSKIGFPSGDNMTKSTFLLTYLSASIPVSDSASMCETGRSTCKGMSTYWLFPTCDDTIGTGDARRLKRRGWGTVLKYVFQVTKLIVEATGHGVEITKLVKDKN